MNKDFLENKNFSYLVNHVRNDVKQQVDYDIFNNKKYISIFKKLIQTIHTSNMNKRVSKEHLNSIVIDRCVPFLVKQIGDDKKKEHTFNIQTPPIKTFERPKSTRVVRKKKSTGQQSKNDFSNLTLGNNDDFSGLNNRQNQNDFSGLVNRQPQNQQNQQNMFLDNSPEVNPVNNIMGKNTRDGEKIDFMKRMQDMENERNYKKRMEDENQFNKEVTTADKLQRENIQDINKQNIRNDNDFFKNLYQNNMGNNEQDNDIPLQNQNYMTPIDDEPNNLDSLYSNNDLNEAKELLENEKPISQQEIDSLIRERSEVASNYDENINLSLNNSNKINSEDIEQELDKALVNQDETTKFMEKTLLSTNRVFERRKKRILTFDVSNFLQDVYEGKPAINNYTNNYWEHFKVNFIEDFIIDKVSDVFLESITINNPCQANNYSSLYKVLDIAEFNVQTNTNNVFMKDKFVLPNENTASSGTNKIMKYHLKSNYICTVNPQKLSSLTFKLTDENNDGVGVSLAASVSSVNFAAGYRANVNDVFVAAHTNFEILDSVYNGNKQFVGIVTAKTTTLVDGENIPTLNFQHGTHVNLINGEKLYVADSDYRTGIKTDVAKDVGSTTVDVKTVDATTIFNVGDKVYLGNGAILGVLSAVTATLLTFESGITHYIIDELFIYKKSPLPKVFASDNSTNKIIMEFVFITR
jgi:hypothetical protein